jgi:hypothetical protein
MIIHLSAHHHGVAESSVHEQDVAPDRLVAADIDERLERLARRAGMEMIPPSELANSKAFCRADPELDEVLDLLAAPLRVSTFRYDNLPKLAGCAWSRARLEHLAWRLLS